MLILNVAGLAKCKIYVIFTHEIEKLAGCGLRHINTMLYGVSSVLWFFCIRYLSLLYWQFSLVFHICIFFSLCMWRMRRRDTGGFSPQFFMVGELNRKIPKEV